MQETTPAQSSSSPSSSSHSTEKEVKLWEGQLYLSHTSEISAKLLYKKFYRKNDVTVLYGKWTTILRQQAGLFFGYNKSSIESSLRYII